LWYQILSVNFCDIPEEAAVCLAVPMKITEITPDDMARCRVGDSDTFVSASVALLPERPNLGDYIIVHAGFALRTIEPADAEETLKLMREMLALAKPEHW
jgi:hydrogenase expression/formation protein HypC